MWIQHSRIKIRRKNGDILDNRGGDCSGSIDLLRHDKDVVFLGLPRRGPN